MNNFETRISRDSFVPCAWKFYGKNRRDDFLIRRNFGVCNLITENLFAYWGGKVPRVIKNNSPPYRGSFTSRNSLNETAIRSIFVVRDTIFRLPNLMLMTALNMSALSRMSIHEIARNDAAVFGPSSEASLHTKACSVATGFCRLHSEL